MPGLNRNVMSVQSRPVLLVSEGPSIRAQAWREVPSITEQWAILSIACLTVRQHCYAGPL
ncbi:protein of unknown function [Pseudomonas marincola]|uniref:Uncharacterized protein n=1 Tax=Pseudomonas marincola TaxID=437900 RepID=A0A8S2B598_9PSED|nr:protein of unknown function [Pseudomonas marincola]